MPDFTDHDMRISGVDYSPEAIAARKGESEDAESTLPDPDDIDFPEVRNAGTRRLQAEATRKMLEGVAERIEPINFADGVLSIPGRERFAHLWIADQDGQALVRAVTNDPTINTAEANADVVVPASQVGGGGYFARSVATAVRDSVKRMLQHGLK